MQRFVIVSFDFGSSHTFQTLSDVLISSIVKHEPESTWVHLRLPEPDLQDRVKGFVTNTIKLKAWVSELEKCDDGDHLIFLDADMLLIKSIRSVFEQDFDVAYTTRTHSNYPINGGIIFIKVNPNSRKFMKRFLEINMKMFNDSKFHQKYRTKYAGMNQSALGYIVENEADQCKMLALPCRIWNSCGEDWPNINEETRVIHIKGQLRNALFGGVIQHEVTVPAIIWQKYYKEWWENTQC